MKEDVKEEVVKKTATRKTSTNRKTTNTAKRTINAKNLQEVDVQKASENLVGTKAKKTSKVDTKTNEKKVVSLRDYLPENYDPRYYKYGLGDGFLVIPSRVFTFIEENVYDWYTKIEDFIYFSDVDFLYSILYFIIEDGYVNIKEMRSDNYYKLTVNMDKLELA